MHRSHAQSSHGLDASLTFSVRFIFGIILRLTMCMRTSLNCIDGHSNSPFIFSCLVAVVLCSSQHSTSVSSCFADNQWLHSLIWSLSAAVDINHWESQGDTSNRFRSAPNRQIHSAIVKVFQSSCSTKQIHPANRPYSRQGIVDQDSRLFRPSIIRRDVSESGHKSGEISQYGQPTPWESFPRVR